MAALLSIPFEVHVSIVRKLSLKDCISYMQVCTVAHDVVCYVFAHRKELDFESVLDESGTIALRPEVLMRVLYAHTRAVSIMNFCFNPTFTLLNEFFRYFSMYWSYKVVDIQQFDPCLQEVGHPSGHLQRIRCLGWDGGSTHKVHLTFHFKYFIFSFLNNTGTKYIIMHCIISKNNNNKINAILEITIVRKVASLVKAHFFCINTNIYSETFHIYCT